MACWKCEYCKTRNCDTDICLNPRCPSRTAYTREQAFAKLQEAGVMDFDHYNQTLRRVGALFDRDHVDTTVAVLKARSA